MDGITVVSICHNASNLPKKVIMGFWGRSSCRPTLCVVHRRRPFDQCNLRHDILCTLLPWPLCTLFLWPRCTLFLWPLWFCNEFLLGGACRLYEQTPSVEDTAVKAFGPMCLNMDRFVTDMIVLFSFFPGGNHHCFVPKVFSPGSRTSVEGLMFFHALVPGLLNHCDKWELLCNDTGSGKPLSVSCMKMIKAPTCFHINCVPIMHAQKKSWASCNMEWTISCSWNAHMAFKANPLFLIGNTNALRIWLRVPDWVSRHMGISAWRQSLVMTNSIHDANALEELWWWHVMRLQYFVWHEATQSLLSRPTSHPLSKSNVASWPSRELPLLKKVCVATAHASVFVNCWLSPCVLL